MRVPDDPMNGSSTSRSADGPDPELIDLPPPRRPFRRLTLVTLAATAFAAVAMIVGLKGDVVYCFAGAKPTDVGSLASLQQRHELRNTWLRGDGELVKIGGIRFERPLESDSFRLAPLQGNPKVWVQIRVPEGYENEYFVAPTTFSGRLVPRSALGLRYSTLAVAPEAAGWRSGHLPQDAWLLIDGETPSSTRWVLGLVGLFSAFALFSLWALLSLLRPAAGRSVSLPEQAVAT
jgi:hypothetical protein